MKLLAILLLLTLTACMWWDVAPTPTDIILLPDLTLTYESRWDACSATEFYESVTLINQGGGDTPPFSVYLNGETVRVNGLAAGESIRYDFNDFLSLNVEIDPDQKITELDESNNSLNVFGGTSSRPCYTPTP
jgi:subtilase family serine protease